jgi:DNA polymerase III epsilon subunit-like protein
MRCADLPAVRAAIRRHGCRRAVLVGHNAAFDLAFLNAAVTRTGIKRNPFHPFSCFDTATLAGAALGQTVLAKAVTVAGLSWDKASAHSATYDAERTADLFCVVCNELAAKLRARRAARAGWAGRNWPRRRQTPRTTTRRQTRTKRPGRRALAGGQAGTAATAPASCSSCLSSPLRYISSAISQPPISSPLTYSCG